MKEKLLETLSRKINKEYSFEYYYNSISGNFNELSIKEKGKRKELINSSGIMKIVAMNYFLCCDLLELDGSHANKMYDWGDNYEKALLQFDITEYIFETRTINKNKKILKLVKS